MAVTCKDTNVVIDGETYSILTPPADSSAVVKAEREQLLSDVDLETFVVELGKVGDFIRIAYNATAGAGPSMETHKLHMKIEKLGFDIVDICSKSAVTITSFRSTTQTVLDELQGAYEYLLDGYEDMAVQSMSCLSTLAKKMADEAWELHEDFMQQYKKVQETLGDTKERKEEEELERERLEKQQKLLTSRIQQQKDQTEQIAKKEKQVEAERKEYEKKRDGEIGKIKVGFLEMVGNMIVPGADLGTKAFGGERKAAEKRADMYGQSAKEKLEEEKRYWEQRQESIRQESEFFSEIESCKDKHSDTEIAIKFLHQAAAALKSLADIMQRAAEFWSLLHLHCQQLADDSIKDQIEEGIAKYSGDRRGNFWRSNGFKKKAVRYYAKWTALHVVCHDYLGKIRLTQQDLRQYIRENPTREEARTALPDMVKRYREDLKKQQERVMNSRSLADARIKRIESGASESESEE